MTLASLLTAALLSQEVHCAAQISYYEARGEPTYAAKVAPVIVARNRVLSDQFPDTFCEVMTQHRQFAFVTNNLHLQTPANKGAWDVAKQAARDVLNMPLHPYERPMQGSLYFHSGTFPGWNLDKIEKVGKIGEHTFYADIN